MYELWGSRSMVQNQGPWNIELGVSEAVSFTFFRVQGVSVSGCFRRGFCCLESIKPVSRPVVRKSRVLVDVSEFRELENPLSNGILKNPCSTVCLLLCCVA